MRASRPRLLERLERLECSTASFERAALLPEGFVTRAQHGRAGGKHNAPLWALFEEELVRREEAKW